MARFEQRISDEAVKLARDQIAAGQSLRAAAAAIGCAPSTLSLRIRKAETAEARLALAVDGQKGSRKSAKRLRQGEEGEALDDPVEVLRSALSARRSDGEPDWRVRISALKLLAALRPDEFAPKEDRSDAEPPITVFDLPPDSPPVLHLPECTVEQALRDSWDPAAIPEPPSQHTHVFTRTVPKRFPQVDDEFVLGVWRPYGHKPAAAIRYHEALDPELAARWTAELAAGRLPQDVIDAEPAAEVES